MTVYLLKTGGLWSVRLHLSGLSGCAFWVTLASLNLGFNNICLRFASAEGKQTNSGSMSSKGQGCQGIRRPQDGEAIEVC